MRANPGRYSSLEAALYMLTNNSKTRGTSRGYLNVYYYIGFHAGVFVGVRAVWWVKMHVIVNSACNFDAFINVTLNNIVGHCL